MKQSSPSVSEDVPLKQKIKTKTKVVVKKAKKEVRKNTVPIQPNAKKFVIPRNKKTRGNMILACYFPFLLHI